MGCSSLLLLESRLHACVSEGHVCLSGQGMIPQRCLCLNSSFFTPHSERVTTAPSMALSDPTWVPARVFIPFLRIATPPCPCCFASPLLSLHSFRVSCRRYGVWYRTLFVQAAPGGGAERTAGEARWGEPARGGPRQRSPGLPTKVTG